LAFSSGAEPSLPEQYFDIGRKSAHLALQNTMNRNFSKLLFPTQ